MFELLQRDVEAIGWNPHMAIQLPKSGHALLVCELRLSASKGVKDHPEKVEAIPPAGLSPVAGVKRTSWLQQPWPLAGQKCFRFLHERWCLCLEVCDDTHVHP